MAPDVEKFHGPTFSSLMDISARKEHSLIRKVTFCSPVELGAIVIGNAVYEVFMDLPECSVLNGAMASLKRKQARLPPGRALRWMNQNLSIKHGEDKSQLMESQDMRLFLSRCPITVLSNAVFKPFLPIVRNELLLLRYNSEGIVEYYCPPLEQNLQKQESCPEKKSKQAKKSRKSSLRKGEKVQSKAESDDSGWETQTV
ncbi:hypothetical protein ANCDUO_18623 [Ancylostoma duodenale]|uniref:Uncharacterized protein n=1 Tax=Ancylostoma duodenale TaxID=51022 RepID=A0A0C2CNG1_9BILA|nr:hypothetical protein ANCDUO_18623 [Ancylostoma duodenale]